MEIDIPDLQDVRFVENCEVCDGRGVTLTAYTSKTRMIKDETCFRCEGQKIHLTRPGERLLEFLKAIGYVIPNTHIDGWKHVNPRDT